MLRQVSVYIIIFLNQKIDIDTSYLSARADQLDQVLSMLTALVAGRFV